MKKATWGLFGFGLAMLVPACSSSDAGSDGRDAGTDGDLAPDTAGSVPDLQVQPTALYSGFDQSHTFRIPVAVYGAKSDVKVTVSDPSLVTIAPATLENAESLGDDGKWYMLTVKKAGQGSLIATSGGKSTQVPINVTSYAPSRYDVGKERYTNPSASGNPACTKCHAGQEGIDHSPAALASARDNEVASVITTGITVRGKPIDAEKDHRWDPTDEELAGLVTYLRALEPRGILVQ